MILFEEMAAMLDKLVDSVPPEYMAGVQGVYLVPEIKYSGKIPDGRHYVMGQYIRTPMFGQVIAQVHVYYGSVMQLYLDADVPAVESALREILAHEVRHHVEALAGCRDLELEDAAYVESENERIKRNPMKEGDTA